MQYSSILPSHTFACDCGETHTTPSIYGEKNNIFYWTKRQEEKYSGRWVCKKANRKYTKDFYWKKRCNEMEGLNAPIMVKLKNKGYSTRINYAMHRLTSLIETLNRKAIIYGHALPNFTPNTMVSVWREHVIDFYTGSKECCACGSLFSATNKKRVKYNRESGEFIGITCTTCHRAEVKLYNKDSVNINNILRLINKLTTDERKIIMERLNRSVV